VSGNLRRPEAGRLLRLPGVAPLVLLYHAVADRPSNGLEIAPDMLRRQLLSVLSRGLSPVTVSEAVAQRDGHVAVTFDDASSSIRELALPVLSELGITATAFVPPPSDRTPGVLTVDDLGVLVESGWEIGSHCVTHRDLTELDDDAVFEELAGSRSSIEAAVGVRCRAVSYPFGAADARIVSAAEAVGYDVGCTLFGTTSMRPEPLCWPRVGIDGREPMLAFRLRASAPVRALRAAVRR
jgi:peptidoglycan/xylan/chitin deacetylase (PgdA/CDA1 family)